MNPQPIRIPVLLILVSMLGCHHPSSDAEDAAATQHAHPTTEAGMRTLEPFDNAQALGEDSLQAIEQAYSCHLPKDYRSFLLENNGGFPSPDCIFFEEAGQKTASDVFCFLAIHDERSWASLEWHKETYSGRLPKDAIPVARDSCGNLWLLHVGSKNTGSVYFWDHGSYDTFDETDLDNWPRVAKSFQEFLSGLSVFDTSGLDSVVPSRYALVKQASDGMATNEEPFHTRENPGFAWHCNYDEDGKATMQFVQYDVHAIATHTDGYSRWRAVKGLIKEGQTRLPE